LVRFGLDTSALCLAIVSFANIAELRVDGVVLGGLLVRVIVIVEDHRGWFLVGHRMRPVGLDGNAFALVLGQILEVDNHNRVAILGLHQL